MQKMVGIIPRGILFEDPNPRKDIYHAGNNYGKRIYESGAVPVMLMPNDGHIPENVLERFDSFLICGGNKFWPYHFEVIHHAITNGKPLLGICLGMQGIHLYFKTLDYMKEKGIQSDDIFAVMTEMRSEAGRKLEA